MHHKPVFLNLLKIRFPVTAIASITHRLSGLILYLAIPYLLALFNYSFISPRAFDEVKMWMTLPLVTSIIWLILAALTYHLIAGIRHFLMDCHIGESKCGGKLGAWLVFAISAILIALEGVYLWF